MKSRLYFTSRRSNLSHGGRHAGSVRLSRVVVAPLLVLALAVGVLAVDTAVAPEPAAAGWGWTTVYETVTTWVCIATPWVAGAYGYAGAKGTVRAFTKLVTKSKWVQRLVNTALPGAVPAMVVVNELVEYVETEIWYSACKPVLTEIAKRVQVWVEDVVETTNDVIHNPNCVLGRPLLGCG